MAYVRTAFSLTPQDITLLKAIAAYRNQNSSDVVREGIQLVLKQLPADAQKAIGGLVKAAAANKSEDKQ